MSFDKAPQKKSLIKHPPSPSMSERQEVRLLTKQLRKLENAEPTAENIKLMLRLSSRIGKLRASINQRKNGEAPSPVKRPVGRPKKDKPPEEKPEPTPLEKVLEAERLRREQSVPEPSVCFEQVRRAEVKAELKKEREAVENPPITAPQSDVLNDGDVITPLPQTGFGFVSAHQGMERVEPFTEYQEKVATEEELRRRYREQHPFRGSVLEEGQLVDSFTKRPKTQEW